MSTYVTENKFIFFPQNTTWSLVQLLNFESMDDVQFPQSGQDVPLRDLVIWGLNYK